MNYSFVSHYQERPDLAAKLNQLTESIWGITVLDGHPSDYVPFSMQYADAIVANVCVGQFDVVIHGTSQPASMIQTVLTHEDHRRRGLIRQLFKPVQQHIAETTGRTFFTANQDKAEFYAQFGYQNGPLIDFFRWMAEPTEASARALQKVDFSDARQRQAFEQATQLRVPVSDVFGFENKPWLLFWFCRHFLSQNLYYCTDLKVYLLLRIEQDRIDMLDIIGADIPTWAQLKNVLPIATATELRCYFVPDKLQVEAESVLSEEDRFFFDAAFPVPERVCIPETQRG